MTQHQIHLAGAVIAAFSTAVCIAQIVVNEGVHWLWLLLLLAGLVAFVVTF